MSAWIQTTFFQPFDENMVSTLGNGTSGLEDGKDTSEVDSYRQGVELTTTNHFFKSTQPKLWVGGFNTNGSIHHKNEFTFYGQDSSFVSFFEDTKFHDNLRNYEPVNYLNENYDYPFPILLNGGPQVQQQAVIEPFTIPFKQQTNEPVKTPARGIKGSVDGGQTNPLTFGNYVVVGFVDLKDNSTPLYFYDFGEQNFGETFEGSIRIPGYVSPQIPLTKPFDDQSQETKLKEFSMQTSDALYQAISALKAYSDDDHGIIPNGKKSASAGSDVYGPGRAKYGTDSIAYIGTYRGS